MRGGGDLFDGAHYNALLYFFFQAEDGMRDVAVTGAQTCALPISGIHERNIAVMNVAVVKLHSLAAVQERDVVRGALAVLEKVVFDGISAITEAQDELLVSEVKIGRASCRERV